MNGHLEKLEKKELVINLKSFKMEVIIKLYKKKTYSEEELKPLKTSDNTWEEAAELLLEKEIKENTALESLAYFDIDTEQILELDDPDEDELDDPDEDESDNIHLTIRAFDKNSSATYSENVRVTNSQELDKAVKELNCSFLKYYIEIEAHHVLSEKNHSALADSEHYYDIV